VDKCEDEERRYRGARTVDQFYKSRERSRKTTLGRHSISKKKERKRNSGGGVMTGSGRGNSGVVQAYIQL